jgi:hypothetical protein
VHVALALSPTIMAPGRAIPSFSTALNATLARRSKDVQDEVLAEEV